MAARNDRPLVSIVTPSFNQAAYLEQAILSVLDQDYPNIEYIVVDGGSADGSVAIIKRYADRLAWWVSEPDKGQAEAINKGLSRAQGEIVAWLNSDDLYRPMAVRQAVDALGAHPDAGLVYSNLESIDESGNIFNTIRYGQFNLADLLRFRIIGQPAVFMRRAVIEKAGPLDTSYHLLLDHHLWLRMAQQAPIKYAPENWAAARRHATAKNVVQAANFVEEANRILEWAKTQPELEKLIQRNGRQVYAGVERLSARYLSENGKNLPALKAYARAFSLWPPEAARQWRRILFILLQVAGLRFLMPKSYDRKITKEKPILVTGLHRSGTSWVGRMLAASGLAYVSEPLNVLHRSGIFGATVKNWYTYISPENQSLFIDAFTETLALDYRFLAELRSLRSPKDFLRMLRDIYRFSGGRIAGRRVLLKDPFAMFSIEWFAQSLDCAVVIVIRHPAAFVSSLKWLGWRFDFDHLVSQPLLMRDWLEPFRNQMLEMQARPDDVLGQASLLWRMMAYFTSEMQKKHPEFLVVQHESLSRAPIEQFEIVYSRLGMEFGEKARQRINRATRSGNPHEISTRSIYSTTLDSAASLENWKHRLDAQEIERIREITGDVAGLFYGAEDWN